MEKKIRDILGYVLSAVLAVVLLGFSFRGIAWSDFWQGVKSCRWEWVLAGMLFGLFSYCCCPSMRQHGGPHVSMR